MNAKKSSKKRAIILDEQQEFVQKICNKIRELREETGYSQEIFAYEHGFDRKQWYNMENGVDMKLSTLNRALKALNITPTGFFASIE